MPIVEVGIHKQDDHHSAFQARPEIRPLLPWRTVEEKRAPTKNRGVLISMRRLPPIPVPAESNEKPLPPKKLSSQATTEVQRSESGIPLERAVDWNGLNRVTDAVLPTHYQQAWFQMIREAYSLGEKGAFFAARRELIHTLYEVAQAKDAHVGGEQYTQALSQGLRALVEADDFAPNGSRVSSPLDIKILVAAHQTSIAHDLLQKTTPSKLRVRYQQYAQQQLAHAAAGVRAGSMALHALGKVTSHLGQQDAQQYRTALDKAIVMQQAALAAYGSNYLAANELGVLVAREGNFRRAQRLFLLSLQLQPNQEASHNLAYVQQQIGIQGHPFLASTVSRPGMPSQVTASRPQVHWVSSKQFHQPRVGPSSMRKRY